MRRIFAGLLIIWFFGLCWFGFTLPGPAEPSQTDAIIVLTGGKGRFKRGLELLAKGNAKRMLVSGVDPVVRRKEFEAVQGVPAHLSECCIDLGKEATDTITNADEALEWIHLYNFKSARLVTTDWHMRRAALELERELNGKVALTIDAVKSEPSLTTLFVEYNKYIFRRATLALEKK